MDHSLEFTAVAVYLIFLVALGYILSRLNRNLSDYVRGGAQGVWWMVGSSVLMSGISAFTFTGNAGAAFSAGPTMLTIYVANCCGFLINYLFLGAWFRQTRAVTVQDIMRQRFGPEVEQFNAYQNMVMGPVSAAIQLWALAVFCGSVFGFPIQTTIVVIGLVVLFYSVSGGRWAVMATDFVQSLILVPITLLMAWLCLREIGGIGQFFSFFNAPEFAADFQLIKEPGQFPSDRFTLKWIIGIFLIQFVGQTAMTTGHRYLSVKDGREAKKAALLAFFMMSIGTVVWFIPPMVARFLYGADVLAMNIKNPPEASYAFVALRLLPNGLLGILVVAMFGASMSSMDTGLNNIAGAIVNNVLPALRRIFRLGRLRSDVELLLCKFVTVGLGLLILTYALLLATQDKIELFDAYLTVHSIITLPLTIPLLVGLLVRRLPRWSYFFIAGCSMVPSLVSFIQARYFENPWTIQDRAIWIVVAGLAGSVISYLCYGWSSERYRQRVDAFFVRMRTPVNFAEEVGELRDAVQLRLLGNTTLVAGGFLFLLVLVPNTVTGRLATLFVPVFVLAVGSLLKWRSRT